MLKHIYAQHFKSYQKLDLDLNENILCCLGKNGSGKSSLFDLISYFFKHLGDFFSSEQVIDSSNPYIQESRIAVELDVGWLEQQIVLNSELSERIQYIRDTFHTNGDKHTVRIEMTQMRSGSISWNIPRKQLMNVSKYLKAFYPVWHVSVRSLDIHSWDMIWEIMGDLICCVPNQQQIAELDTALVKIYDKYGDVKPEIDRVMKEEGISVNPYRYTEKFSDILKVRLGGDQFTIHDRNLKYYSDGTNSFEYLRLLLSLIPLISEYSMKYPVILIDEPEIGLHNALIADFVRDIGKHFGGSNAKAVHAQLLMATHSAKLIEVLTSEDIRFALYRMGNVRLYTKMNQMNLAFLREGKHTITPLETECYFTDYIVYVEGETEIQLFHDPYLRMLFHKLNRVHFYQGCADLQKLHNVHSKELNLGIPYRIMLDMDKILYMAQKDAVTGKLQFAVKTKEQLNPLNKTPKGRYDFGKNDFAAETWPVIAKKEILRRLGQTYHANQNYMDDPDFEAMLNLVQQYCRRQGTLVNRLTIEGDLVTVDNLPVFEEFLKACMKAKFKAKEAVNAIRKHKNFVNWLIGLPNPKEKSALLVYCLCGNLTVCLGGKRIPPTIPPTAPFKQFPKDLFGGKTSKWVNWWLEYYCTNRLSLSLDAEPDNRTLTSARAQFQLDFPSLYANIHEIEKMVRE